MFVERLMRNSANGKVLIVTVLMFAVTLYIPAVYAGPISILVSPVSAPVGGTISVSGVNASLNGEVRIYVAGAFFVATTVANATGGYSVNITVPAVPSDTYPIMALDMESGDTASSFFTVEPRVLLTPAKGSYNDEISVRGEGFAGGSFITILFDGNDITPSPQPQTDFLGSFTASIYVPSVPNGTYKVLAFDSWVSASAAFDVAPMVNIWPTGGAPYHMAYVGGYGFAPSVNVTLRFGSIDVTPYPWLTTWLDGSFGVPFFVPGVADGTYMINASDTTGNMAAAPFTVPGPVLVLTPDRTYESSVVTAKGEGFQPFTPIVLHLEDMTVTSLIDFVWMSQNLMANEYGSFEYSFIVPVTKPGVYDVAAYMVPGPSPSEPVWVASASLTIADSSSLDVQVDAGSMHFRGELAEFYVKTAFDGMLVNATIDKATLFYANGTSSLDLTSSVVRVATGLYRVPYAISGTDSLGTYVLLVQVSYSASLIEAFGTASGGFIISPSLTGQSAQLVNLDDKIGTVVIPNLGTIKVNLTTVNARLVDVQGSEATIQSDIGTLKTSADTINARVISIDGNAETISSDLGTVIRDMADVKSHLNGSGFQIGAAALVFSVIAAVGAVLSVILVRRMRLPKPPVPPKSPEPEAAVVAQRAQTTQIVEEQEKPEASGTMHIPDSAETSEILGVADVSEKERASEPAEVPDRSDTSTG